MRVISQKRDYSVDFKRTPFWMQSNYIYALIGDNRAVFGVYETAERVREVFEDMHDKYGVIETCAANKGFVSLGGFIYCMPEV